MILGRRVEERYVLGHGVNWELPISVLIKRKTSCEAVDKAWDLGRSDGGGLLATQRAEVQRARICLM